MLSCFFLLLQHTTSNKQQLTTSECLDMLHFNIRNQRHVNSCKISSVFALAGLDLLHLTYPTLFEMLSHCVLYQLWVRPECHGIVYCDKLSVNWLMWSLLFSSTECRCTSFAPHMITGSLCHYLLTSSSTYINILYSINLLSAFLTLVYHML